jgi:hypothetical protein
MQFPAILYHHFPTIKALFYNVWAIILGRLNKVYLKENIGLLRKQRWSG